jgi:predicted transcriptional regulator
MIPYRTTTQIIADLLDAAEQTGQERVRITHLLSKASISHSRLSGFIENLTGSGLINKIEFDGTNTFVITQREREYLEPYRKFSSIAEFFGLEL